MSSWTRICSWINDHTFVSELASTDLACVRWFLNPPVSWLSPKQRSLDFKDRGSGLKKEKKGTHWFCDQANQCLQCATYVSKRWLVDLTRRWAGWSAGGDCEGIGEHEAPSRASPRAPPATPWHQAPQLEGKKNITERDQINISPQISVEPSAFPNCSQFSIHKKIWNQSQLQAMQYMTHNH